MHYKFIAFFFFSFFFVGCVHTRVVLLDSGKANSSVIVSNDKGSQKIDAIGKYVRLKNKTMAPSQPEQMSEEEISRRFSKVLSAIPKKAISHIVYFKPHSTDLTEASKEELIKSIEDIRKNAPCMVDIIGHTDTVGSNEINAKVSLKRAQYIESLLKKEKVNVVSISAKGYGEEDLMVETPDNTDEEKNRNVEIFIK